MKIGKITFYILCAIVVFVSCNKDDNNTDVIVVEARDRAEQQVIDKDSLIGYLETHYYNSSDFVGNLNPSINDLIIAELAEGETSPPVDHTLLIDVIEVKNTVYLEVDYEYYILRLNQGGGIDMPHFSDEVRVIYSGNLLDEVVFDSSVNPVDFDLTGLVSGWSRVFPEFNVAESYLEPGDGTVSFLNAGVGVMFLPSGLAYFSTPPLGISAYSNLIFKFELYQTEINDHDLDGVPSYLEDIDGDLNLGNDDTDGNTVQNFIDADDDGDGILTKDEIVVTTYEGEESRLAVENLPFASNEILIEIIEEEDGTFTGITVTFTDTDGDGTPDYLDAI